MVDDILTREVKKAEFLVGDIFDVESYSPQLTKMEINVKDKGDFPFVMQSSENNGVVGFIDKEDVKDNFHLVKGGCLSAFNHVNEVYYQPEDFYCKQGGNMFFLRNEKMTQSSGLYLASALTRLIGDVGYGKNTQKSLLPKMILLPVTEDGTPDWDYMNDYMIAIQKKHLSQVEAYNRRNELILKKAHPELDTQGGLEEPEGGFREFLVGDIFDFYKGKRVTRAEQKPGETPYITAVSSNNGIDAYISNPVYTISNVITVSFMGDVFYHPYEIGIKDGTYGAQVKRSLKEDVKESSYLYLTFALKKAVANQGSYSKMLTDEIAAQQFITLPATQDGTPDWDYMEEYMNHILKTQRESEGLHHRKEETILRKLVSLRKN